MSAVTVIMPTAGATGVVDGVPRVFVDEAVRSILRTAGSSIEAVVIVTDRDLDPAVRLGLERQGVRIVVDDRPFNFADRINLGVAVAATPQVLLLNDDVEAHHDGWLDEMLAVESSVDGVVGACLVFEDERVQHLGHVFAAGLPSHLFAGRCLDDPEVVRFRSEDRECSGVTAACLLMSVERFEAVGAMSRNFPLNYNDTDLCLKVRRSGGRCMVASRAVLSHYESRSWDGVVAHSEIEQLWSRWWKDAHHEQFWRDEAREIARGLGVVADEEWM